VAVLGIGTLIVGTFYPMMYGPKLLEIKSVWSWGGSVEWDENWNGVIVVAMAMLAAALVWKEKYRWLLPIGAIALYLVRAVYIDFNTVQAHAPPLRGRHGDGYSGDIGLDLGLGIMVVGAVLLIIVSLLPPVRAGRE
jgi:hypothetical protein